MSFSGPMIKCWRSAAGGAVFAGPMIRSWSSGVGPGWPVPKDERQDNSVGNVNTLFASPGFLENIRRWGYSGFMDEVATVEAAAEILNRVYPADDVGEAIRYLAAKKAARETAGRATGEPRPVRLDHASKETTKRKRGPRVKPNPALPKEAPEIYRDRKPREERGGRKENIVQFIERVYAPWRHILTRADLRRLDDTADKGVENLISSGKKLPKGLLRKESELNTEALKASGIEPGAEAVRLVRVLDARLRRGAPAPT